MSRDTRFKPGQSGNPKGRPKGSKNEFTHFKKHLLRALVDRQFELYKVKYVDLLKAWTVLMPKEVNIDGQIEHGVKYITQCPRPAIEDKKTDENATISEVLDISVNEDEQ